MLVARGAHLAALRESGFRYIRPDGTMTLRLPVAGGPDELKLRPDDLLVLATKTQDADAALAAWAWQPVGAGVAATELPVLTVQNGLDSERSALRRFTTVFGAVSWSPTSHVAPGEVVSPAAPVESEFLNGEIVLLARLHGREAPANAAVLARIARAAADHTPARSLTDDDLAGLVQ